MINKVEVQALADVPFPQSKKRAMYGDVISVDLAAHSNYWARRLKAGEIKLVEPAPAKVSSSK